MTRKDNDFSKHLKFSDRDTDSVSNRSLLANALEAVAQTPAEKEKLAEYQKRLKTAEDAQERLDRLNALIREKSFAKGPRDTEKIEELRKNARGLAKTINAIDKKLLDLEATGPLKDLLEREKKSAYKRAEQKDKEALAEYRKTQVVLGVEEIEESPSGSARDIIFHDVAPDPDELSTIKVADLLGLVKGEYEKYLPKFSDRDYMDAVSRGDMETAQKMVDEAARDAGAIKAYHGTSRSDRVGNVFLPERATSGPMAFFSDNREIAEHYAKDKADTSLAYDEEYADYYSQFRVKRNGKNIKVQDLWRSTSERRDLCEDILRSEWGYHGIVMTDWLIAAMPGDKASPYRKPKASLIAAASGELVMPGDKNDVKDILEGLQNGNITREQLEINASRLYRVVNLLSK